MPKNNVGLTLPGLIWISKHWKLATSCMQYLSFFNVNITDNTQSDITYGAHNVLTPI